MKRLLILLLSLSVLFCIPACFGNADKTDKTGNDGTISDNDKADNSSNAQAVPDADGESASEQSDSENGGKILIAYFSRTGENYNVGTIEKGNTHIIADIIAKKTGGETFEIRTETVYPDGYHACTDVAKKEQEENARPKLLENLDSLDGFDIVFIGYPIWLSDMPMAVYTFIEGHDFSGKTVIPFCTHEGSGLSGTEKSVANACSGAVVLDGLAVRGSDAQNSQSGAEDDVTQWLEKIGILQ